MDVLKFGNCPESILLLLLLLILLLFIHLYICSLTLFYHGRDVHFSLFVSSSTKCLSF